MSTPERARIAFSMDDEENWNWLTSWTGWPDNLEDLQKRLKAAGISVEDFKNSARYEANLDSLPWLKEL